MKLCVSPGRPQNSMHLLVKACESLAADVHETRPFAMCDCCGAHNPSCYLGGCYCNQDAAAEEARAMGLLVRCGGGLPCACSLANDSIQAAGEDPLAMTLSSVDPSEPTDVNGGVEADFVFAALSGGQRVVLPPLASPASEPVLKQQTSCCGAGATSQAGICVVDALPVAATERLAVGSVGGPPAKRSRCQCYGEGGPGCMCGPNCACLSADVEMASLTMMELAAFAKQRSSGSSGCREGGGGGCCCAGGSALVVSQNLRDVAVGERGGVLATTLQPAPISDRGQKRDCAALTVPVEEPAESGSSCCGLKTVEPTTVTAKIEAQLVSAPPNRSAKAERPFPCEEAGCEATFVFKQNRDRHLVEVHQPERRPYHCQQPGCSAAFKNSSGLKQHASTVHQKNRPFKCDRCNASFGQRNHLTQHTKVVHLGDRPFACMVCDARFSNRGNLNQHIRRRKHHPADQP
jgi:Zinc finger, C2H2 type